MWSWSIHARFCDFAKATGRLAKTDAIDAELIARFAQAVKLEPRPVADAEAMVLDALLQRRRQVVEMRASKKIRLQQAATDAVQQRITDHIVYLDRELGEVECLKPSYNSRRLKLHIVIPSTAMTQQMAQIR